MWGWRLAWPLRFYLRSPLRWGRTFLAYRVLWRLLPDDTYTTRVPGGGQVKLPFRSVIGLETLLAGAFEPAELEAVCAAARPGTVAVDVGANVGLFTVALSATGATVWALEPLPRNAEQLEANVGVNPSVEVLPVAAHDTDGNVSFHVAVDPAFGSVEEVKGPQATGRAITVPAVRLDTLWEERGRPRVSVVKVDVEGGEAAVLRGAERLLDECRPVVLIETADPSTVEGLLPGYSDRTPAGFSCNNHLFTPG